MVLSGKLITELGIKTPAERFYKLFAEELHEAQVHCERVHHTKLHEGEDWHDTDTVKHLYLVFLNYSHTSSKKKLEELENTNKFYRKSIVIDGEVHTCYESIEEVDKQNKRNTWKLFGGDIDKHYKVFKMTLEVTDKADGTGVVKWVIEYEKIDEDIDPPNGYMDYLNKCTRDIDAHLIKGEKVAL